jgi:RimK family alpha-L-glutamate ligase
MMLTGTLLQRSDMNCWLIYKKIDAQKNKAYIDMYETQCKKRNISIKVIIVENTVFAVCKNVPCAFADGEKMYFPDFAINRSRDFRISEILENAGVSVFNSANITKVCNDKMLTVSEISALNINVCDTFLNANAGNEYPFVMKSVSGHGGLDVFKIENQAEYAKRLAESRCDFITQKMVSEKGKDLRVYVIGKEIIAAMLRTNENDFRSNFSLGGNAEIYTLSHNERAIVNRIAEHFEFAMVGIDFMFDNGELVFNEIEDAVGARMLYKYTDIDIVELYFDFIVNTMLKR